jgi:hypothetical protein
MVEARFVTYQTDGNAFGIVEKYKKLTKEEKHYSTSNTGMVIHALCA